MVLDCDAGFGKPGRDVGDALALAYLLGSRAVDLLGITTTFGVVPVDVAHREIRGLVGILGREEVPVFHGAPWPGHRPTEAAHFLARMVRERPGTLTVVATGPLSNLRAASDVHPGFFAETGRIVCSGGVLGLVRLGWGRIADRNLSLDPASAQAVLRSRRPVTILSAELCAKTALRRTDLRAAAPWPRWARRWLRGWMLRESLRYGGSGLPLWDLLPAVYATRAELFEDRSISVLDSVEELSRGVLRTAGRPAGLTIGCPARVRDPAHLWRHVLEVVGPVMSRAARR